MGLRPAKSHEKLSGRRLADEILWGRLVTCGRLAIGPCRLRGGPAAVTNRRAGCQPAPHWFLASVHTLPRMWCNHHHAEISCRSDVGEIDRDRRGWPMKTLFLSLLSLAAFAQGRFQPGVKPFLASEAPMVALTHVRVIDGTGAAAREDQTVIVDHGKIAAVGPAASTPAPAGARIMDLAGHTVIPGIVGMHEHLFYPGGGGIPMYPEMAYSFPRLYLASGVTTARTAGSLEPYTDLNIKSLIESGRMPGPKLFVTGPYLEGKGAFTPQMHELADADDATRTVNYWADEGVTSFKAYMNITRAELKAAADAAHRRGIKVTGHLCSIGFREAAAIGIDNLEHGLVVASDFVTDKKPDECPTANGGVSASLMSLDVASAPVQSLIRYLVSKRVALTSTLTVFETFTPGRL